MVRFATLLLPVCYGSVGIFASRRDYRPGLDQPPGQYDRGPLERPEHGHQRRGSARRCVPEDHCHLRGRGLAHFSGEIDGFGPLDGETKKAIRKGLKIMCRESQMGVAAAQRAIHDAGLEVGGQPPAGSRVGVVFGSDYMMTMPEEFISVNIEGLASSMRARTNSSSPVEARSPGMDKMPPLWLLKYLPNMPASHIAIYNDMRGHSNSITHQQKRLREPGNRRQGPACGDSAGNTCRPDGRAFRR